MRAYISYAMSAPAAAWSDASRSTMSAGTGTSSVASSPPPPPPPPAPPPARPPRRRRPPAADPGRRVAVGDVSRGVDRPGHRVDPGQVPGERGIERRGVGDVGERAKGHQREGIRAVVGEADEVVRVPIYTASRLMRDGRQVEAVERSAPNRHSA